LQLPDYHRRAIVAEYVGNNDGSLNPASLLKTGALGTYYMEPD
jgi:hypothetical protein